MNVDNKDGKLKPGMFVRAIAESKIAGGGKVMDPSLTGKWISPMHPEIVKDGPGSCDVCGMKLVRAEELGYISAEDIKKEAPIVIPASAPLITGKRSVVYVQVPGKEGVYEGRNVVLGPRAGDYYIVKEGLSEGEVVVVNGNFKIDSAIQILAKPSMMNPDGGVAAPAHSHGERKDNAGQFINHKIEEDFEITFNVSNDFLRKLDPVYTEYFNIQNALSHDKLTDANKSATKLLKSVEKLAHQQLDGKENELWMKYLIELENSGDGIEKAETIEAARMSFEKLSNVMIKIAQQVGSSGNQPVLLYHCPMAFEYKGANWLQNKEGTENPYFGSQMFTCGTQESIITPGNPEKSGDHQHE
jgi:Cu(I)/Ag(I) efflux system membrane fusion protein